MKKILQSPGWRTVAGFMVLFLAVWLATVFLGVVPNFLLRALNASEQVRLWLGGTLSRGGMMLVTVWLSAWMLRRVTGLRAGETIYRRHLGWWQDLLFGLFLGFFAMALLFGLEIALGWLSVNGSVWQAGGWDEALGAFWLALLANGLAAVGEEAMFRGYFLTGLKRAWGPVVGLLVMSIPFGASHLLVTGASETNWALFTLMLALPGMLLGWAYLRTGSLWLPMGIHFTWNFLQADVFNLTGEPSQNLVGFLTQKSGPDWFMGTSYGIEVGLAGLVALSVVGVGVWLWTRPSKNSIDQSQKYEG